MRIGLPCLVVISVAALAHNQSVPENGVTIRGNVNKPGVYLFVVHDTVLIAIDKAGGFSSGLLDVAYIYRTDTKGISHTIPINLRKILKRKSPDFDLQPGDVLDVPFPLGSPPKNRPVIDVPNGPPDKDRA